MFCTKFLQNLVPKSATWFCYRNLSLLHRSRQVCRQNVFRSIESNAKTLNFVKLFSDDVQPVNGKKKRRRVISSDEEDIDDAIPKKRFVLIFFIHQVPLVKMVELSEWFRYANYFWSNSVNKCSKKRKSRFQCTVNSQNPVTEEASEEIASHHSDERGAQSWKGRGRICNEPNQIRKRWKWFTQNEEDQGDGKIEE